MNEYPTQHAALEALLDDDHEAAAQQLARLQSTDLRHLAHVAQDLQQLCHSAWVSRLAWRLDGDLP